MLGKRILVTWFVCSLVERISNFGARNNHAYNSNINRFCLEPPSTNFNLTTGG